MLWDQVDLPVPGCTLSWRVNADTYDIELSVVFTPAADKDDKGEKSGEETVVSEVARETEHHSSHAFTQAGKVVLKISNEYSWT